MTISSDVPPQLELFDFVAPDFGNVLYSVLSSVLDVAPFPEPEQTRAHIGEGRSSFLFEGEGRFEEQG